MNPMTMSHRAVKKELATTIKSVNAATRTIEFVASQRVIDGEGEVIEPSGVDLSRYRKNPVVLLQHDHHRPIGRTVSLMLQTVDNIPSLLGRAVLPEGDEEVEQVYRRIKSGLYAGVSVGFLSRERGGPVLTGQKGVTHTKSELVEISVVTVPSCPTCVITAKAKQVQQERFTISQTELTAMMTKAIVDETNKAVRHAMMRRTGRVD